MVMPLSDFERRRLISLWAQFNGQKTASQIKRALAQERDFTALQTIKDTITRWQEIGSVLDRPQNGQAKMIPLSHYRFIDDAMAENDEHTAGDLKKLLVDKFGEDKMTYIKRTISRVWNDLGWTFTTARYFQAIRDANKQKRVDWVNLRLEVEEQFQDVIFTDECTVQLECHCRKSTSTCQRSTYGVAFPRVEPPT